MDEANVPLIIGSAPPKRPLRLQKAVFFGIGLIILMFVCIVFQLYSNEYYGNTSFATYLITHPTNNNYIGINQSVLDNNDYLVNSAKCKIVNLSAFNAEAKKFYKPHNYIACTKLGLLSYITKQTINNNNGSTTYSATLHIDTELAPSYSSKKLTCCYSNITRVRTKGSPDDHIKISSCTDFKDSVQVSADFVMIKCRTGSNKKPIYENTHATLLPKADEIETKNKMTESPHKPYSVLLLGIDSISRLNLIRTLPATHQYLKDNDWIGLQGYNKMGDNTFPNLMAILTGYNQTTAYAKCEPTHIGNLDRCNFIWNQYRQVGYVTAYAEDEVSINTFNYNKKGFDHEPTNYYFRPLMMASEKMKVTKYDTLSYCIGPESYGEKVMNLAKDFATTFQHFATFSLFWMNTFSHNNVNAPGGMDVKIRTTLKDIAEGAADSNSSIVIFLSDHGIRFGDIRYTHTGWLEERLPFVYISLPPRFKQQYAAEYANLRMNVNRLTSPYDLHMTLQHILVLSGVNHTMQPSQGCAECVSLFTPVPPDRSCEQSGITPHWCTCYGYTKQGINDTVIENAKGFLLAQLRNLTSKHRKQCADFSLKKVHSIAVSEPSVWLHRQRFLLIVVETLPKAFFEATISYDSDNKAHDDDVIMQLQGTISRVDSYASHSNCIADESLKKYCYCL